MRRMSSVAEEADRGVPETMLKEDMVSSSRLAISISEVHRPPRYVVRESRVGDALQLRQPLTVLPSQQQRSLPKDMSPVDRQRTHRKRCPRGRNSRDFATTKAVWFQRNTVKPNKRSDQ
eukprot:2684109-Rhodomonas_salina.1